MFNKYINRFGKAEAEWAMEVLDMHDGDEEKAKDASSRWWQIGLAKLRELGKIPPAIVPERADAASE